MVCWEKALKGCIISCLEKKYISFVKSENSEQYRKKEWQLPINLPSEITILQASQWTMKQKGWVFCLNVSGAFLQSRLDSVSLWKWVDMGVNHTGVRGVALVLGVKGPQGRRRGSDRGGGGSRWPILQRQLYKAPSGTEMCLYDLSNPSSSICLTLLLGHKKN